MNTVEVLKKLRNEYIKDIQTDMGDVGYKEMHQRIEALAKAIEHLDCPYEPWTKINVREHDCDKWKKRTFVAMCISGDCVCCLDSEDSNRLVLWRYHEPLPKTIPLNLDADVVEDAKIGLGGATATDRGDGIVEINNRAFVRLLRVSSAIAQAAQGEKGE